MRTGSKFYRRSSALPSDTEKKAEIAGPVQYWEVNRKIKRFSRE